MVCLASTLIQSTGPADVPNGTTRTYQKNLYIHVKRAGNLPALLEVPPKGVDQTLASAVGTPFSFIRSLSSPEAYISRTMSQPPTNSPFT